MSQKLTAVQVHSCVKQYPVDNNHYKIETTCMILGMQIMILNVQNLKNPYMWNKVTKYRVCMGVDKNKVL